MRSNNKTRCAILGILLESPSTGYEIKSLMGRSTVYFWRESDSTIYPMLKVLAKDGKVLSEVVYVGKKKLGARVISVLKNRVFSRLLDKKIEERLENIADSPRKTIRLKALRYGLAHLESEIRWLNDEKGN